MCYVIMIHHNCHTHRQCLCSPAAVHPPVSQSATPWPSRRSPLPCGAGGSAGPPCARNAIETMESSWDFIGFHREFMGFHLEFMGLHREFMGLHRGFHREFMGLHREFMGFHMVRTGFHGIQYGLPPGKHLHSYGKSKCING